VDLAQILRQLWKLRRFVAVVVVLAAFGALSVAFKVSLLPPNIESKSVNVGAASTELLVDSNESPLVALNDQYVPLTERAAIYARFMSTPPVRRAIAEEVGLPEYAILTQSSEAANPAAADAQGVNGADPGAVEAPAVGQGIPYQLTFLPRSNTVSVFAQAPTARGAERLANGAVSAFKAWILRVQEEQSISPGARIELRQLGRAQGGIITEGADRKMAVLAFFGLLAAGCLLILAIANVLRNLRDAEASESEFALAAGGQANGHGTFPEGAFADYEPFFDELEASGRQGSKPRSPQDV
jgi:hypothetical protein